MTDLINNAGVSTPDHPHETVATIVRERMMEVFNVNIASVAAVTSSCGVLDSPGGKVTSHSHHQHHQSHYQHYYDHLQFQVVNISSGMGSLTSVGQFPGVQGGGSPSYRCSKAALNMLTVCFSKQFPDTTFAMVHPGWVQTDMGGSAGRTADIGVEESVAGIVRVLRSLEGSQSGQFLDWQGKQLPF